MRKPLVASGGGFEAPSVKPVGDGGSAAQGSSARGVKATLGEGGGAERVLVRVQGQGEPKPGSRGTGVICGRPATAGRRRVAPGQRSGLRPKRISAKGNSGTRVLTEGAGRTDSRRRGTGGEVRAAKTTRSPGRSRCRRRGRRRGSEVAPGAEAELVRCYAGALVWRSGGAAAAQSGGTAELRCCGG